MKKILLLSSLILIAQSANAFVDSQYLKTEQFLVNTGYSAEAAKVLTKTTDNPYREQYDDYYTAGNIFRRMYHYIAPTQEADMDFYNHSIRFNGTSWRDY